MIFPANDLAILDSLKIGNNDDVNDPDAAAGDGVGDDTFLVG